MKASQILMMGNSNLVQSGLGYLYNWYTVSNANFAPSGWHTPTKAEYDTLVTYLGGASVAGHELRETGVSYWAFPNTGATNSSGFSGRGGGYRSTSFTNLYTYGWFWTSDAMDGLARYLNLLTSDAQALKYFASTGSEYLGMSVRFIKDDSTDPGTVTDYEGNIYPTVKIDSQVWTARNWKCTKLNDGTALTLVETQATWDAATAGNYYYCAYNNNYGLV